MMEIKIDGLKGTAKTQKALNVLGERGIKICLTGGTISFTITDKELVEITKNYIYKKYGVKL